MILNHISIGISDLEKAVSFYDAVLETLSINRTHYIENAAAAYGERFEFWIGYPIEGKATSGNGMHVALNAPSKDAVMRFYKTALELGGQCEGQPEALDLNMVKLTMRHLSEILMGTS